jgi:hypothetical protein
MSKAGSRILKSVSAARAYARGDPDGGFVLHVPSRSYFKAKNSPLRLHTIVPFDHQEISITLADP